MIRLTSTASLLGGNIWSPYVPWLEQIPSMLDKVGLNPQPLPPRDADAGFQSYWAALNRQPSAPASAFDQMKAAKDFMATFSPAIVQNPALAMVGGTNAVASSEMNKGIIIVGGRVAIR